MPSVLANQSVHVTGLAVSAQYNPKELGVEQASASEPCSTVCSISGFGTYDPVEHSSSAPCFMDYTDDCAAVYQHNQTDMEFRVARLHAPIDRELHDVHGGASFAHSQAAFDRLDPDAFHLRVDFAMAVGAHAAARSVAKLLRTIHRARHPRRGEHALPAHPAIEQESFHHLLRRCHRPLEPHVTDAAPQRIERDERSLECVVEGF